MSLQTAALETSKAILQRQRRMEQELLQAKTALEALSQQQTHSLSLLNATLDASPAGVIAYDLAGEIVACNRNFVRMWGLPEDMVQRCNPEEIRQHCASQSLRMDFFRDRSPILQPGQGEELALRDGRVLECVVSPQFTTGQHSGTVVHWQDVTERKRAEAQRNRTALIMERSLNEIYLFDQDSLRFEYANASALLNLGYDLTTLQMMTAPDILAEFGEATFRRRLQPLIEQKTDSLVFETVHQRADHSRYNVQMHLQLDTQGTHPVFVALVLDITERKRAAEVIWKQAHYDQLTQLPNRVMLKDRLAQEMASAKRNGVKLALMFVDLDKFKEINDTLGHDKGDLLLQIAADRIRSCLRGSDTLARMGGDEFVVLLPDLHDGRMVSDVAQKLLDALRAPFELVESQAVVSGSIGITIFPDDGERREDLLKNADQAMYVSKGRGRNQYSYFTPALEVAAHRRMQLISQLRQALRLGQFVLHFQPIVDITDRSINKAEALIRWQHPELGLVSPAEFIPLAEETGLIVEIGEWVVDEALNWVKVWRDNHRPDFQVSVNKSPVQFNREGLEAGSWAHKLASRGLPGSCLAIEITEGVLIDGNSAVRETLVGYRQAGIQVAIDDFGTGYSSLSYLKRFDVDYLKIDRSFISQLEAGGSDMALTQAIIAMAHALELQVVAEGVETEAQRSLLAGVGCDFAQGYLFSRPVPPTVLSELLAAAKN